MPQSHSLEAWSDFYGLPSSPISIFHTGPAWPLPTGPQAQRIPKEARPVCDHPIALVWRQLGEQIHKHFDSVGIKWTSIDPVHFAEVGGEPGPLFLWVGVMPNTLSRDDAEIVAIRCKEILAEYNITDVEPSFRESIFTRSAGVQLLDHVFRNHPNASVQNPFTPALGLPIALKEFPYFEGTGCLYLREGGDSDRVLLLTARHVVLPPSMHANTLYHCENSSASRLEVIHLGSKAFQITVDNIIVEIGRSTNLINDYQETMDNLRTPRAAAKYGESLINDILQSDMNKVEDEQKTRASMNEFHTKIIKTWSPESERVLGHVLYAPPITINVGPEKWTEDWGLVELDRKKFDWSVFRGNAVHLGTELTAYDVSKKMHPHAESIALFRYPPDRLMQLRGFVQSDELRHPTMLSPNRDGRCLVVFKNGLGTGVTFGRMTGLESFVRDYNTYGIESTSMELALHPYSSKDGAFSASGDSGSVVANTDNRIVGMLTGGAGKDDCIDVTYATPYYFINERIKEAFPNSHLYPVVE